MKYLLILLMAGCSTIPTKYKTVESVEIGFVMVGYVSISTPYRDGVYRTISESDLKSVPLFKVSGTEDDDCDDSAMRACDYVWKKFRTKDKGVAFGPASIIVDDEGLRKFFNGPARDSKPKGNRHMLCVFFDENEEPKFYEPQTGVVLPVFELLELGLVEDLLTLTF